MLISLVRDRSHLAVPHAHDPHLGVSALALRERDAPSVRRPDWAAVPAHEPRFDYPSDVSASRREDPDVSAAGERQAAVG